MSTCAMAATANDAIVPPFSPAVEFGRGWRTTALAACTVLVTTLSATADDWSGRFLAPSTQTLSTLIEHEDRALRSRADQHLGAFSEDLRQEAGQDVGRGFGAVFGNAEAVFKLGSSDGGAPQDHVTQQTLSVTGPWVQLGIRLSMGENSDLTGTLFRHNRAEVNGPTDGVTSGVSFSASFRF